MANKKIKILLPVAGKFKLSHNVGGVYNVEAKQANELIKAKYAEVYVEPKDQALEK